ncbi:hypothetical protein TREMEDRAFT_29880, partial [Tremella mesenterica DSM 1558]|uniref:uncharacterized protein n=1 Tax=Tremella mesenterica (strain ATCC 24925 / CBS 8224 / DSM 1558 / NBRC 9311 / NRRL Y-6157 / RJB 2259-6 / UBC 559-6) TaxID=578456 RepID=UPI0003F4A1EF
SIRRNPVGVQMLSPSLHSQLFPGTPSPKPDQALIDLSISHLSSHGLSPSAASINPEISFDLPPLQGKNIREHFYNLGQSTAEPYLSMAKQLASSSIPPIPESWEVERSGWTKYFPDGRRESVDDLGEEKLVIFDVETLYKLSPYPVLATAATPTAWYSWISPTVFENPPEIIAPPPPKWEKQIQKHHPHDLIPLFKNDQSKPRVVIGHNVGYDRARVLEEYSLERTSTRWIDTLSLHVATRGITSVQRPAWIKHRKGKMERKTQQNEVIEFLREQAEIEGDQSFLLDDLPSESNIYSDDSNSEIEAKRWQDVTSVNSLAEVASLHCGHSVDKSIRNRFSDETIKHASMIRLELQELISYCAKDVKVTHEVYRKVFPLFLQSCPHPATFGGILTMGNSFLPVDESWRRYLRDAEGKYQEMEKGVRKALRILADNLRLHGKGDDPWSDQLDWTPKPARWAEGGPGLELDQHSSSSPTVSTPTLLATESKIPDWYSPIQQDPSYLISTMSQRKLLPLILRMTYKTHPVAFSHEHFWCFMVPHDSHEKVMEFIDVHGPPLELSSKDTHLHPFLEHYTFFRIGRTDEPRKSKLTGSSVKRLIAAVDLETGYPSLFTRLSSSDLVTMQDEFLTCAKDMLDNGRDTVWGKQLDWSFSPITSTKPSNTNSSTTSLEPSVNVKVRRSGKKTDHGTWPKWYWDLTAPSTNSKIPFGELDLTVKKIVAPLLLRLQWQSYPLVYSRQHKWLYKVPKSVESNSSHSDSEESSSKSGPLSKSESHKIITDLVHFDPVKGDEALAADKDHIYLRLPHKDGEGKNVGNPLSKSFVKAIESGELSSLTADGSEGETTAQAARDATQLNALCSYWISSRERIMDQLVHYPSTTSEQGMILPQMITMGTVTRRAVEATWLTASNAKPNRVGSELKAMVRAPPGYSIVGADVDSEELWISSVMGDSQFGFHGSTAIGWMTLEGTKSTGTDLHSKTASILSISRDAAKVFNYSRIYGAGVKHAIQLLLQGDPTLNKEEASKRSRELYKSTKGMKIKRNDQLPPSTIESIWHGGSESFLFNTLESIASSEKPLTPALNCGITNALKKSYLDERNDYLPSRINWVVQSSGVDYLHMLLICMEYLIRKYEIKARYIISVHDEIRYLVEEKDKYKCGLALQISNAWTRSLFCYNLGMKDLPQGVTFFSSVDFDIVWRKEVTMDCKTPSHDLVIPPGESLDILQILDKTGKDGLEIRTSSSSSSSSELLKQPPLFSNISSHNHILFLRAQADKYSIAARKWLDSQKGLKFDGMVLPPRRDIRKVREGMSKGSHHGPVGSSKTDLSKVGHDKLGYGPSKMAEQSDEDKSGMGEGFGRGKKEWKGGEVGRVGRGGEVGLIRKNGEVEKVGRIRKDGKNGKVQRNEGIKKGEEEEGIKDELGYSNWTKEEIEELVRNADTLHLTLE